MNVLTWCQTLSLCSAFSKSHEDHSREYSRMVIISEEALARVPRNVLEAFKRNSFRFFVFFEVPEKEVFSFGGSPVQEDEFILADTAGNISKLPLDVLKKSKTLSKVIRPFHIVDSADSNSVESFQKSLRQLNDTDRIFVSFVPPEEEYYPRFEGIPAEDYFHLSKRKDLASISSKVDQMLAMVPGENSLSYKLVSAKVAESLRISFDNIGDVFCFKKTSPFVNNDASSKFDGISYHVSKFKNEEEFDLPAIKGCLLNDVVLIEHSQDMDNFLSTMGALGMKDILVVSYRGENPEKVGARLSRVNRALTKGESPSDRSMGIALVKDTRTLQNYVAI